LRSAAATELSTPPLIATTIRAMVLFPFLFAIMEFRLLRRKKDQPRDAPLDSPRTYLPI